MIVASILTPLEHFLRHVLNALHSLGLPWSWSIVGLTIIVRMLLVYVTSQLASTYFMSGTMQKTQRWLMMLLPFAFIPFILRFPAGLVLYWMTTNLWTVGQGLITRHLVPKTPAPSLFAERKSSRTPPKDDGAGGGRSTEALKPQPHAAAPAPPRKVRRKKKAGRR